MHLGVSVPFDFGDLEEIEVPASQQSIRASQATKSAYEENTIRKSYAGELSLLIVMII